MKKWICIGIRMRIQWSNFVRSNSNKMTSVWAIMSIRGRRIGQICRQRERQLFLRARSIARKPPKFQKWEPQKHPSQAWTLTQLWRVCTERILNRRWLKSQQVGHQELPRLPQRGREWVPFTALLLLQKWERKWFITTFLFIRVPQKTNTETFKKLIILESNKRMKTTDHPKATNPLEEACKKAYPSPFIQSQSNWEITTLISNKSNMISNKLLKTQWLSLQL